MSNMGRPARASSWSLAILLPTFLVTGCSQGAPGKLQELPATPFPVRTLPSSSQAGLISMPWRQVPQPHLDDRHLLVSFAAGDGDCTRHVGFSVTETTQSVSIAALSKYRPPAQGCADMSVVGFGIVTLHSPLATRHLTHRAVDPRWSNMARDLPSVAPR
ncbi:MAG: hypothetical protein ACTHK1_02780 [Actinomycetales bacterium]